jgi:hypothetical protein
MSNFKKYLLFSCCYVIFGLLSTTQTQADEVNSWGGSSGTFDSVKATEQREAEAKKKAKRQKAAEERKAAEAKKSEENAKETSAPNH